jgi:hypothetical protein
MNGEKNRFKYLLSKVVEGWAVVCKRRELAAGLI